MSVKDLIPLKADLLEMQLIAKVNKIIIDKINDITIDINSLKTHPEITTFVLELFYNLAYEFKLKKIDLNKMSFDLLVSIFNLNLDQQNVVQLQINSHVKNNDIVLISNYTKLKSCVWKFLKKVAF